MHISPKNRSKSAPPLLGRGTKNIVPEQPPCGFPGFEKKEQPFICKGGIPSDFTPQEWQTIPKKERKRIKKALKAEMKRNGGWPTKWS